MKSTQVLISVQPHRWLRCERESSHRPPRNAGTPGPAGTDIPSGAWVADRRVKRRLPARPPEPTRLRLITGFADARRDVQHTLATCDFREVDQAIVDVLRAFFDG